MNLNIEKVNNNMNAIVIGAGASGLTCAITLARRGISVTVFEKLESSAKKILVTGNGRCNYWNEDFNNKYFHSNNEEFIKEVNTEENRKEVLSFFDGLGIVPFIKNGYYYPMSMQASSIRDVLLDEVNKLGIKVVNNSEVINVKKMNDKFFIETTNGGAVSDYLIVATGSNAYYKNSNLGYNLCKTFGHNIIDTLPSLVQLVGDADYFNSWAGIRNNSKVTINVDKEPKKEEIGELMLTDYGISGICVFNISGIAAKALHVNKPVEVELNFLPNIDNLNNFLEERSNKVDKELGKFFEGILNKKLVEIILKKTNLNKNKKYKELNDIEKNSLINNLSSFKVKIVGTKDFSNAQVSSGGVDTKEVDPKTFESKLCNGLYIIGEVLDVDGDCGGYNLGFAWLSGIIAGRSVKSD